MLAARPVATTILIFMFMNSLLNPRYMRASLYRNQRWLLSLAANEYIEM
jgi:hypothetical protein